MPHLRRLRANEASRARFLFVYIAEAHAEDEWPIRSSRANLGRGPVSVKQPTKQAARIEEARAFARDFEGFADMVVCDDIERGDEFERDWSPWPFRFFGLTANNNTIGFVSRAERGMHDPSCIP